MAWEAEEEDLSKALNCLRGGAVNEFAPGSQEEIRKLIKDFSKRLDDIQSGRFEAGGASSSLEIPEAPPQIPEPAAPQQTPTETPETPVIHITDDELEALTIVPWECVVCMDRFPFHACLPCGHICLCSDCLTQMTGQQCPVCMMIMSSTVRLYPCHPYPWSSLVGLGYTERAARRAYGRAQGNLQDALRNLKSNARVHHGPGIVEVLDLDALPASQGFVRPTSMNEIFGYSEQELCDLEQRIITIKKENNHPARGLTIDQLRQLSLQPGALDKILEKIARARAPSRLEAPPPFLPMRDHDDVSVISVGSDSAPASPREGRPEWHIEFLPIMDAQMDEDRENPGRACDHNGQEQNEAPRCPHLHPEQMPEREPKRLKREREPNDEGGPEGPEGPAPEEDVFIID